MPLFTHRFDELDPLFSMAFHPERPEFVLGFASGRVECYEYNDKAADESDARSQVKTNSKANSKANAEVDANIKAHTEKGLDSHADPSTIPLWSTQRHKGSCRALAYDQSGESIVSCGSDGVVKKCNSRTGKVSKKTQISAGASSLCINEEYVVIGDEDGTVHILTLDLKPHRSYDLEDVDSVTCVRALDTINKHNFAVSGAMHVFRIDARKDEVVSRSEDQEDEVLCGCIASDARSAWGMCEGVLTVWNNRGLGDQQQRVKLTKDGSVDAVLAGEQDNRVIAGTSDGWVADVDILSGKVLNKARHNPEVAEDDVSYLDYDYNYRLVSGSMSLLRVWAPGELAESEAKEAAVEEEKAKRAKRGRADKDKKSKKKKVSAEPKAFADLLG